MLAIERTRPQRALAEINVKLLAIIDEVFASKSFVFSPISISIALAMFYAGARGVTRLELERVLFGTNLPEASASVHAFYAAEIARLNERDKLFTLELTNKLYVHADFALANEFVDVIHKSYGGSLERVDFANREVTAKLINDYVALKTHDKIPRILEARNLKKLDLLAMNVAYFKGTWRDPFPKEKTTRKSFFVNENLEKQVWMMRAWRNADYYEDDRIQMLVLPYESTDAPERYGIVSEEGKAMLSEKEKNNKNFSYFTHQELENMKKRMEMWLFLPKRRHALTDALGTLTERDGKNSMNAMRAACAEYEVEIDLPRFKIDFCFGVNEALVKFGATSFAPGERPDYRGVSATGENPRVGKIFHRALIEVDEEGTVAAAVTFNCVECAYAEEEAHKRAKFTANQPFAFAIAAQDTALFAGVARMESEA